jgi:hypothetical protein
MAITSFQNTVNRIAEKINPNNPPTVAQLQAKGGEIVEFFQGLPPTHIVLLIGGSLVFKPPIPNSHTPRWMWCTVTTNRSDTPYWRELCWETSHQDIPR